MVVVTVVVRGPLEHVRAAGVLGVVGDVEQVGLARPLAGDRTAAVALTQIPHGAHRRRRRRHLHPTRRRGRRQRHPLCGLDPQPRGDADQTHDLAGWRRRWGGGGQGDLGCRLGGEDLGRGWALGCACWWGCEDTEGLAQVPHAGRVVAALAIQRIHLPRHPRTRTDRRPRRHLLRRQEPRLVEPLTPTRLQCHTHRPHTRPPRRGRSGRRPGGHEQRARLHGHDVGVVVAVDPEATEERAARRRRGRVISGRDSRRGGDDARMGEQRGGHGSTDQAPHVLTPSQRSS
jgi:hypothetical protein